VILADTSAWVEYDRATESAVDQRMIQLMAMEEPQLSVTEPVMMEVLAGARSEQRERDLRRLMQRFPVLLFDPASDFDAAARIYRRCRAGGMTPRGMVDCIIAAVACRHDVSLLAQDVDLVRVCRVIGVTMDQASVRI
jgi:predicted nucleic acid-binding protein